MKSGEYIGSRAPYGYRKSPQNCHKLIIDEETAPIVKQIFDWAYNKIGYNQIVKRLNEQGIMTPSKYAQSKGIINNKNLIGNEKWQTRTIRRILSCELYTGDMVQGKTQSIYRKAVKIDKESWIRVNHTHEPIISHHIFETVHDYCNEKANRHKNLKVIPYSPNIFKGKIFCGHCGGSLNRMRVHNKNYIYKCIANDRISKGICRPVSIKEDNLMSEIFKKLHNQFYSIGNEIKSLQNITLTCNDKLKNLQNDREFYNNIIKTTQKFLKGLYESLVNEVITNEEYFSMKLEYETNLTSSLEKITEIEEKQKNLESQISFFNKFANDIDFANKYTCIQAELVEKFINKILIYEDKKIDVSFNFEDDYKKIKGAFIYGT